MMEKQTDIKSKIMNLPTYDGLLKGSVKIVNSLHKEIEQQKSDIYELQTSLKQKNKEIEGKKDGK